MRTISFSPPDISEREIELVGEAMRSGWITTGPRTKQLEALLADFCGTEETACVNSATAALELCLRVLGIGPGDEVITTAYTYTSSASVISHVGAKTVMVDTAPGSYFMDYEKLAAAVTPRTKAIIPVDLAGVPVDYKAIQSIVESKRAVFTPSDNDIQRALGRIAIVSDSAHALGTIYDFKPAAIQSDFACYSFHAVKNLTTAEGGAIAFSSIGDISADDIYHRFMLLSLHGQSKDALAKTKAGAWEYDIIYTGYKYNMTDIMAAIGIGQLERYPALLARRYAMVKRYNERLSGSRARPLVHNGKGWVGSHHLFIVDIEGATYEERNAVIEKMGAAGISCNVHYKPLPMMTAYKNLGFDIADYPNAYDMFTREITLPLHTLLSDDDIDYIADEFIKATK